MAETDSSPAQKPHVYDLLGRLNAAFARVRRNMDLMEQAGIFDPRMLERIRCMAEELRADANYNFLDTLKAVEARDRAEFSRMRQQT
jgi:hypothetical protein